MKKQEKTTGNFADKLIVEHQPQELNATLQFQSDLVRLLNSLSELERMPTQPPLEDPATKSGREAKV